MEGAFPTVRLADVRADEELVLIFHSIHRVLAAEKAVAAGGLSFRLVPTPRPFVSSCGLALLVQAADWPRARSLLEVSQSIPREMFVKRGDGGCAVIAG